MKDREVVVAAVVVKEEELYVKKLEVVEVEPYEWKK